MSLRRWAVLPLFLLVFAVTAAPSAGFGKHDKKDKKQQAVQKKAAAVAAPAIKPMDENRQAEHVLNRIGYGARPGDVERVRAMGVRQYIEQQLRPEKIDDHAIEARLSPFETLKLSNEEI